MNEVAQSFWKKCSTCKKPILFGGTYYTCSVSTCNGQRTGYVFCSMTCFESHLPGARHRDAGAIESKAPSRMIARPQTSGVASAAPSSAQSISSNEVLIIASRLKDYVQAKGDMNTSGSVMDVLSDFVRVICDRAIENARADGRKTLMDRDLQFLKNLR